MSVIDIAKDAETRTLTVTAQFDAPPARVWQVWSDPRQLERWWGPPTYPATVVEHEFSPGGAVNYFMTSPEGERFYGWWRFLSLDPTNGLEFEDGFSFDDGRPNPDMPTTQVTVTLEADGDAGTRMLVVSTFPNTEAMDQLVAMGMVEGLRGAMGQIPSILESQAAA